VLVEKPMATSVEDCDAMLTSAASAGKVLAVGFQQRFRKNNREARRLIREGALGDLMLAHVAMLPSMQPMLADPGFAGGWEWWRDPRSLGHVINAGPHAVDLLRWAFDTEVQSVSAMCRTFQREAQVEDTTAALLELKSGAICSFNSSLMAPAPSFPGEEFRFRFLGSKAVMDLDPYGELRLSVEGSLTSVSVQEKLGHQDSDTLTNPIRMGAYNRQIEEFLKAIDGAPAEIATGQDGRASLAVCLAMLESSSTGSVRRMS
jgi:predicted dehydrogenase